MNRVSTYLYSLPTIQSLECFAGKRRAIAVYYWHTRCNLLQSLPRDLELGFEGVIGGLLDDVNQLRLPEKITLARMFVERIVRPYRATLKTRVFIRINPPLPRLSGLLGGFTFVTALIHIAAKPLERLSAGWAVNCIESHYSFPPMWAW